MSGLEWVPISRTESARTVPYEHRSFRVTYAEGAIEWEPGRLSVSFPDDGSTQYAINGTPVVLVTRTDPDHPLATETTPLVSYDEAMGLDGARSVVPRSPWSIEIRHQ